MTSKSHLPGTQQHPTRTGGGIVLRLLAALTVLLVLSVCGVIAQADALPLTPADLGLEPITPANVDRIELLGVLPGTSGEGRHLISPDNRYMVSTGQHPHGYFVRELATGRLVYEFDPGAGNDLYIPSGITNDWLLLGRAVYDLKSGTRLVDHPDWMRAWYALPEGGGLLISLDEFKTTLWRLNPDLTYERLWTIDRAFGLFGDTLMFAPDGSTVTALGTRTWYEWMFVRWDAATGDVLDRADPPAVYRSPRSVIAANGDAFFMQLSPVGIRVFDFQQGEETQDFVFTTPAAVTDHTAVTFTPEFELSVDGTLMSVSRCLTNIAQTDNCSEAELVLFDTTTRQSLFTFSVVKDENHLFRINHTISRDNRLLVMHSSNFDTYVWGVPAPDVCRATALQTARVRAAPNANGAQVGGLATGEERIVLGQAAGGDGFTWWAIYGGWVRSDLVSETGRCDSAPVIAF